MMAYKRDDPNAAISSVPLEKMHKKDFDKTDTGIEAPYETEKGDFSGQPTQEGDEALNNMDDDDIIDPKALYKNFVDLVANDKLKIIRNQVKRDGMGSVNKQDDA